MTTQCNPHAEHDAKRNRRTDGRTYVRIQLRNVTISSYVTRAPAYAENVASNVQTKPHSKHNPAETRPTMPIDPGAILLTAILLTALWAITRNTQH